MDDKKPKGRIHRETLNTDLADALLKVPSRSSNGETVVTVGQQLIKARETFVSALEEARKALGDNPLTPIVAAAMAKQSNRRGQKEHLVIDEEGTVILEVHYKGSQKPRKKNKDGQDRRDWSSKLPSLDDLREQAEDLGIDISSFGRAKKEIMAAIETARKSPKPKMMKTAPALSPVTVLNPGGGPNSLDKPSDKDEPTPSPKTPPKGVLTGIQDKAKELDLSAILTEDD